MKCLICKDKEFKSAASLGTHLWKTHNMKPQKYYDVYLKTGNDGKCAACGCPTRFRSIGQGYLKYCSKKCAAADLANDPERNEHKVNAMRETCLHVFGVDNATKAKAVQQKRKRTMKERYNVEYYSQTADYLPKFKKTMVEHFGVDSYMKLPEFQDRLRKLNMSRIGVPYRFNLNTSIAVDTYRNILAEYNCELIDFNNKKEIEFKCNYCGNTMVEQDLFIKGRVKLDTTPCSCCRRKDAWVSIMEDDVRSYIEGLGFMTDHYDRDFLDSYGADIVIESKKLIVEFDGVYWHSEKFHSSPLYHLTKTLAAEKKGYRLVHLFSSEWLNKPDVVKSRLRNMLGLNSERIFARKCVVKYVPYHIASEFVKKYHIQGECRGVKVSYGLYQGDRMVAVMMFGADRFNKTGIELLRYCTLPDVTVVGGAGKLFAEYVRNYNPDTVVSFADRRWSGVNAFYDKLGFQCTGTTSPSYYYVIGEDIVNRMTFQKHKLVAQGFDANKTEHEIMLDRKIYRIYDCGNYKYVWTKPNPAP